MTRKYSSSLLRRYVILTYAAATIATAKVRIPGDVGCDGQRALSCCAAGSIGRARRCAL